MINFEKNIKDQNFGVGKKEILKDVEREVFEKNNLLKKLTTYLRGGKFNPKVENYINNFIENHINLFLKYSYVVGREDIEGQLLVESSKIPSIMVGIVNLLEQQLQENSNRNSQPIHDAEIIQAVEIISQLAKIDSEDSISIKRGLQELFTNRNKTFELSKRPDFKEVVRNAVNKKLNINNDIEVTYGITGPVIAVDRKFNLMANQELLGAAVTLEIYGESVALPIILISEPKKIFEGVKRHEQFHLISRLVSKQKKEREGNLNTNLTDEQYENIYLDMQGERFLNEVFSSLGGINSDLELAKIIYSDSEENENEDEAINYIKQALEMLKTELRKSYFPEFTGIKNKSKLSRRFEFYTNRIFALAEKYPEEIDLIAFSIIISKFSELEEVINKLEVFLQKYKLNKISRNKQ